MWFVCSVDTMSQISQQVCKQWVKTVNTLRGDGLTITMKRVHMRIIRQFNEQEKDADWNHIQTLYKKNGSD